MFVIKIMLKIVCIPVLIVLTLMQWIAIFFTKITSTIFGIVSTVFWGFAIVGFIFGALTGHETIEMMIVAFVVFIIPQICGWMLNVLGCFRLILGDFLRS